MKELFTNQIFIQGIGFVGLFVSLYVFQCKKYDRLVLFKILSELIFALQLFLLNSYSGAATNLVAVFANLIYRDRINKNKPTFILQIIFSILFVVVCILTWHGWMSMLVIVAKVLSTVSMGIKNTKYIRFANLIINPLWLIYDAVAGSIGGAITDFLSTISVVIGILRLDIKKPCKEIKKIV